MSSLKFLGRLGFNIVLSSVTVGGCFVSFYKPYIAGYPLPLCLFVGVLISALLLSLWISYTVPQLSRLIKDIRTNL